MRGLLLLALGLGGCAAEAGGVPPQEWRYAVAYADCAPWDGGATTIELSDSPIGQRATPPDLRITVYRGLSESTGQAVLDGMRPGSLTAARCTSETECVQADSGWVDLTQADTALEGRYRLHLSDGRTVIGRFSARVIAVRILCG